MLACLDVTYRNDAACAAGVIFRDWADANPLDEKVVHVQNVEPYQPGQFYRRELPCLLAVLKQLPPIDTAIIDGYVWLDGEPRPGLGAHLHKALNGNLSVVGVAKTKFHGANGVREVIRGSSKRPLFVTAVGIEQQLAANHVRSMHGDNRLPTLLARADYLCRHGQTQV
jgi:deoxyribonuclease V